MGPRAGLDRCGKSRPLLGFDPRTVRPVVSHYTDWTTRPTDPTNGHDRNFWATFALLYFPSTTFPIMKFAAVWPRSDDCPNYFFYWFGAPLKFLWSPMLVEANFMHVAGGRGAGLMNCGRWSGLEIASSQLATNYGRKDPFIRTGTCRGKQEWLTNDAWWNHMRLYKGADKSLAQPEGKNNWKVAIFRPTLRSLLPRRPGWTDNHLNFFFEWLARVRVWSL